MIDREAIAVTSRLSRAGYDAYIVGGAVRDLLLGMNPKDFDVVTNALPRKIRKIFRNSRIIGRRFQLVHVIFRDKVIEVSTFRTASTDSEENIFGTMSEDVVRRDFTMNALYYDPDNEFIIDYVGGYEDILKRRVKPLIPADASFLEDPVRMIRALRYASTTGFDLQGKIPKQLKKRAILVSSCSVSRLTEELFKILGSGNAQKFFDIASKHGLLSYLIPEIGTRLNSAESGFLWRKLSPSLDALDAKVRRNRRVHKGEMIAALAETFLDVPRSISSDPFLARRETFMQIKSLISPLTPPNIEVEKAAQRIIGGSPKLRRRHRSSRFGRPIRERHMKEKESKKNLSAE